MFYYNYRTDNSGQSNSVMRYEYVNRSYDYTVIFVSAAQMRLSVAIITE